MDILASGNPQNYERKKKLVAARMKNNAANTAILSLKKETSNLFRTRIKKTQKIDLRHFNQVIAIDRDALQAEVEGMITYEAFVQVALAHGYMPAVVPELKTITVGGALAGVGIESSSFRYGLMHETVTQFDVLLSDGRVIDCRADNEYSDLFYAFPNSYGTLGYALKITVKLVPVKPYVKLQFHHFCEQPKFFETLESLCLQNRNQGSIHFIDGVIFSENHQVLVTGEMTDRAEYCSNYRYMNIYYRAIETKQEDYLTIADYIWRWDTDWFWCSKALGMQNLILRFLLGPWMLKSRTYSKITRLLKKSKWLSVFLKNYLASREFIIQDVAIPMQNALNYSEFFQKNIGIVPIWVCPIYPNPQNDPYHLFKMMKDQLYVNFGFWSSVPAQREPGYYNRLIERKVCEYGGNKSLYSDAYYTRDEFWNIYDESYYQGLKNKYDPCGRLNTLYSKCVEKA